jgi:hypothetical protein
MALPETAQRSYTQEDSDDGDLTTFEVFTYSNNEAEPDIISVLLY